MSKITLATISNPQNLTSLAAQINSNNAIIQTAFDNTLSRDGTVPDQMLNNLDMNSNQILNLPAPAGPNSPARLVDVNSTVAVNVPPTGTSGAVMGLLNTNNTYSGNDIYSGTSTFNGAVTFNSTVALPANSVGSSQVIDASLTGTDIAANTIVNNNLATMPSNTIKGNNTGISATPLDLTASQLVNLIGTWGNNTATKSANYTVLNADSGSTIILGGGSYFTLTLNAANTYNSNFVIRVVCQQQRGVRISASGITSFILWPGQSTFLYVANGVWNTGTIGRWQKSGVNFYVDTTNGVDTNDGLAPTTGAFKTINAAVQALYNQVDCQGGQPTINIAAGTYTESVTLQGQITGFNFVLFQGAGSTVVTWKPTGSACLLIGDNAECQVAGIKFDNSGGTPGVQAISMHQPSVIDVLSDINFGQFTSGIHIGNDKGGYVNLPASYTISGGVGSHIQVTSCAVTQSGGGTVTITGSPGIGFMYYGVLGTTINFAGTVTYSGAPAAGTQKYNLDYLSCMVSSGSTIPGTVAGAVGHNSVFA